VGSPVSGRLLHAGRSGWTSVVRELRDAIH
jgi:hypothetical protein